MEQRPLGHSGLSVSRLALGTMTWGRDTDTDDAGRQLRAFVDAGGTLVDTADRYADGESERILGRLLAARGAGPPRAALIVATKAGLFAGPPAGRAGRVPGAARDALRRRVAAACLG